MNKSIIGWIFAALVFFACLGVIAVGGFLGLSMNSDLTKTRTDLTTANQTVTQQSADLDKARGEAAQLQTSLDEAQAKIDKTICPYDKKDFDYSSNNALQTELTNFTKTYANVSSVNKNFLTYGFDGPVNLLWTVTVSYSSGGSDRTLVFIAYPSLKALFFSDEKCWLQAPE